MAPSSERHQRPVLEEHRSSGPTAAVVLHARAGIRRPRREGDSWRQIEHQVPVVYYVPVAASLAILAVTRVIDDEIRGPVDMTSAHCLNTVPGNCLDCVAESQTGSGERRGKHQPNCNAFDFIGGHESPHTRHCWARHTSLSRLAAVAPPSCRPVGEMLSHEMRAANSPMFPQNQGRRTCHLNQARREQHQQHLVSAPAATFHPPVARRRLPLINATRLLQDRTW